MGREPEARQWIPPWVGGLGVPVWISGPDRTLSYMNRRAEDLLGVKSSECMGNPCHMIIQGIGSDGKPVCGPACRLARRVWRGGEIEPVEMRVGAHWVRMMTIKVRGPDPRGPYLVHCALPDDRAHRIEVYLERVSKRTRRTSVPVAPTRFKLTPRETEVLAMLADDETLYSIADGLNVSYATVRNHVQHILTKLGVHSIMEAVAYYILTDEGYHSDRNPRRRRRDE